MNTRFVIPYRDRADCLASFLEEFPQYLDRQFYIPHYAITIVEQEDGKPFNLGCLINVGFDLIRSQQHSLMPYNPEDNFIWHPVDSIPLTPSYDITEAEQCVLFCDEQYDTFFARFIGFRSRVFEQIQGYANTYWGWGVEDEDLMVRLGMHEVPYLRKFGQYRYTHRHYGWGDNPDYNTNRERFLSNKDTPQYFQSDGLNTLQYDILSTHQHNDRIFQVKVSI